MFEYLMPLLFTQTHENSLLDRACYEAVRCRLAIPATVCHGAFRNRPLVRLIDTTFINTEPLVSRRWH